MAKFILFKSTQNSQYYFRLESGNGEPILSSEGYVYKSSCEAGVASVKANASNDARYDRKNAPFNYTFNLKGNNGEIIGRSENYTTAQMRDNGIVAVKRDAPGAPIVER